MYSRLIFLVLLTFLSKAVMSQSKRAVNDSTTTKFYSTQGIYHDCRDRNTAELKTTQATRNVEIKNARVVERRQFETTSDSLKVANYKPEMNKSAAITQREKYIQEQTK